MTRPTKFWMLGGALISAWLCAQAISCRSQPPRSNQTAPATSATTAPAILPGFSYPSAAKDRDSDQVTALNAACVACHKDSDAATMHTRPAKIACIDCHGGESRVVVTAPL